MSGRVAGLLDGDVTVVKANMLHGPTTSWWSGSGVDARTLDAISARGSTTPLCFSWSRLSVFSAAARVGLPFDLLGVGGMRLLCYLAESYFAISTMATLLQA